MKNTLTRPVIQSLLFISLVFAVIACDRKRALPAYEDITHASAVFHHPKFFRLYLPDNYKENNDRYPVIYFFHGWGGRHFKDDNAKLAYEKIKDLVNKYQVILVMWDGNIDEKEPRPYNVGNHSNITSEIQMKDYFPELVAHIDSTYRTLAEKSKRGIIGFSMGGFMSYYLAGKYPDKVGAAVDMTGSPEFFVGTPGNHTLYPVRYAFKNLRDVKLRFHNSTADELTYLNTEVHKGALREGGLSYEYWQFVGGHFVDLPGKTDVFERAMKFVADAFESPLPRQEKWWHYDLYPEFDVWDYQVQTNKHEPGFIYLKGVSEKGFGVSTLKWLPDGPPLDDCTIDLLTAPLYTPGTTYQIIKYRRASRQVERTTLETDGKGRLHFMSDREGYEAGIFKAGDAPDLLFVDYEIENNKRLIRAGVENMVSLRILNRGGDNISTQKIKIVLTPADSTVTLARDSMTVAWKPGERTLLTPAFILNCNKKPTDTGAPASLKFNVSFFLNGTEFKDEFDVPVFFDVPVQSSFTLDDGRQVNDSVQIYGKGNGDGIASPGEEIMVYIDGHRARLYSDDPYIERDRERVVDEVLPAKWPDGFTLSSVIRIDSRCPAGHRIECLADYETKEFMPINRKLTWAKVLIDVKK